MVGRGHSHINDSSFIHRVDLWWFGEVTAQVTASQTPSNDT